MKRFFTRSKLARMLKDWFRRIFLWERWRTFVSVNDGEPRQVVMGCHKWHTDYCADPFLFRWQNANWLFYETLDRKGKGILGCFKEVNGEWVQQGKILELGCHLSYPQVFEDGGRVYMIPESFDRGNGEVALYETDNFPFCWKKHSTLIPGGYVDSTLLRKDGHYYLACDLIYPNETAEVWHSSSLFGPWTRHPQSGNISQSPRLRRCGGAFLEENGRLFRIAQDCNGAYGKRVYKVPITDLSENDYHEGDAELLLGRYFYGKNLARHTYNVLTDCNRKIVAFDVRDYKLQPISHVITESVRFMFEVFAICRRGIKRIFRRLF